MCYASRSQTEAHRPPLFLEIHMNYYFLKKCTKTQKAPQTWGWHHCHRPCYARVLALPSHIRHRLQGAEPPKLHNGLLPWFHRALLLTACLGMVLSPGGDGSFAQWAKATVVAASWEWLYLLSRANYQRPLPCSVTNALRPKLLNELVLCLPQSQKAQYAACWTWHSPSGGGNGAWWATVAGSSRRLRQGRPAGMVPDEAQLSRLTTGRRAGFWYWVFSEGLFPQALGGNGLIVLTSDFKSKLVVSEG